MTEAAPVNTNCSFRELHCDANRVGAQKCHCGQFSCAFYGAENNRTSPADGCKKVVLYCDTVHTAAENKVRGRSVFLSGRATTFLRLQLVSDRAVQVLVSASFMKNRHTAQNQPSGTVFTIRTVPARQMIQEPLPEKIVLFVGAY